VIFGDGAHTRDFLYVKDCAETLVRVASADTLVGEVVNLGYGEETRIDTLAQSVLEATGRGDLKPIYEAPRPADVPKLWVDTTKLKKAIDFRPRVSLREGIGLTLTYFEKLYREDPTALAQITTRNWEKD
jgi:UDP-glucose 4-epimerase